jgi:hypothetical protein
LVRGADKTNQLVTSARSFESMNGGRGRSTNEKKSIAIDDNPRAAQIEENDKMRIGLVQVDRPANAFLR